MCTFYHPRPHTFHSTRPRSTRSGYPARLQPLYSRHSLWAARPQLVFYLPPPISPRRQPSPASTSPAPSSPCLPPRPCPPPHPIACSMCDHGGSGRCAAGSGGREVDTAVAAPGRPLLSFSPLGFWRAFLFLLQLQSRVPASSLELHQRG